MQKRTKIIATIGPASHDRDTLKAMIRGGMDVARLNFSHGSLASHALLIHNIRTVSATLNKPVAIMQDLSGPKLRLGEFRNKQVHAGQHLVFGRHGIPIAQPIWKWIKPSQTILIDDGLIELMATKIHPDGFEARVIIGGTLISHKGVSLPGVPVHLPILSGKDLENLEFGLSAGVDMVAMSFVKTSFDIAHLRLKIRKLTKRHIPIIAKIETPEALKNIDKIIEASDAVMIARGDLALNINQALVPVAQKNIIKKSLHLGKPVIVATQMLESMTKNPRPTRAEISDVANAVMDHADCVMLSSESAFGAFPVKAVETMSKIITQTEASPLDDYHHSEGVSHKVDADLVLAHSLIHIGRHAKISAVLVSDADLAARLSHFRPNFDIILAGPDLSKLDSAAILWGVTSLHGKSAVSVSKNAGILTKGSRYINALNKKGEACIEMI